MTDHTAAELEQIAAEALHLKHPRETREGRETDPDYAAYAEQRATQPFPTQHPRETWEGKETDPWLKTITGTQLDAMTFPPLTYLHDEVRILSGGLVYLSGPPKSAKSLLALGLALGITQGGGVYGSPDPVNRTGTVLYISLDDTSKRRAQKRLRDMNSGQPIPANLHLYADEPIGAGSTVADHMAAWMTQHPDTALIVVDTLEAVRPRRNGGESHYSDDVRFLATFRRFLADFPDVTLLALGHTRKGDDTDAIAATGGTHGITGGTDQILRLSGKRGAPRRVLDIVSRDDDDRTIVFTLGNDGLQLSGDDPDDPTIHMTDLDRQVYMAVQDFNGPVTAGDLESLGIPKVGNRLGRMAKEGYLIRKGRGSYEVA